MLFHLKTCHFSPKLPYQLVCSELLDRALNGLDRVDEKNVNISGEIEIPQNLVHVDLNHQFRIQRLLPFEQHVIECISVFCTFSYWLLLTCFTRCLTCSKIHKWLLLIWHMERGCTGRKHVPIVPHFWKSDLKGKTKVAIANR